jgi:glycine oxidase
MRRSADVLVLGGGVIGCAVAQRLAAEGCSVLLVERGALGAEASAAGAGVLAVGSGDAEGPVLELRRASLARYATLAAALAEETGIDVEYDVTGVLELLLTEEDEAAAAPRLARRRAQGFHVERLDAIRVREEAPRANSAARGALLFPDDAQVHNDRLVAALAASARRRGAELVPGTAALAAERAGNRIARVCVGAEWVTAETVVLAAGAWSAHVAGLAPALPVEPARGQMVAVRPRAASRRVLSYADGYLVTRRGGEVLVGATVERVGFDAAVTPAGLAALRGKIAALAPALLDAPVTRVWAGLRPWAPGGGPIVGRALDTANLVLACGHHRNGILLAPITAELVAAIVTGAPPPLDPAPFLPPRAAGA